MIVPMKHISLFILKKDERRIMKTLQRAGAVELSAAAAELQAEKEQAEKDRVTAPAASDRTQAASSAEGFDKETLAKESSEFVLAAEQELAALSAGERISDDGQPKNRKKAPEKSAAKIEAEESARNIAAAQQEFLRVGEQELAARENDVQRIKGALSALVAYIPKEGVAKKLAADPECGEEELIAAIPDALAVCDSIDEIKKETAALKNEKERLTSAIAQLKPFTELTIPAEDIASTKSADFITGLISASELEKLREAGVAFDAFGSEGKVPIVVAVPRKSPEETEAILKKAGFVQKVLPDMAGTASENKAKLEKELEENAGRLSELRAELADIAQDTSALKRGYDGALIEQQRAKARCDLFATRETVLLTGWVRSDMADDLEATLNSELEVMSLELRDPYDEEQPPTYCKNNKFFAPFEVVTNMYSPPDPRGYDPTTVMAPFYLLFFGLMMGDTGYGLLMTLFATVFYKLKKPRGSVGQICQILIWGGISTMIFGLLAGTCFGMNWYDIFGPSFPFPLLDPMKDQMTALIVYCALGFGQIIAGMIVSIVLHLKRGDWQTALFDIGSWLLIFTGAALALLLKAPAKYVGFALLGSGLILLVGFGGRAKKGVGRVIGGLGKLYDITGFLSDVLSYSRVFALGLATGAMGSAFNLVANIAKDMLKGIPVVGGVVSFIVAAILLAVLHVFCMAINALGAFIHCARLQFIEYYNRFYTPGGRLFAPLGMYTKHNRIK